MYTCSVITVNSAHFANYAFLFRHRAFMVGSFARFFFVFRFVFLGAFFKIFSSLSVSDVEDRQLCFVQSLVFIFCISSFFKTFLNHLPMFTPLQWLNAGCYSVGAVGYSARNATWKSISNP